MGHLLLSKYANRCVLFVVVVVGGGGGGVCVCVYVLWGTDSCYLVIFKNYFYCTYLFRETESK